MANPTFFSEGSTPNRNDTEWEILQKMLGALTDLSGGGGGPFLPLSGGTLTGDLSVPDLAVTGNGALSDPSFSVTGTPITGGTATTTKPLALIETAGATSTNWTTTGTMLGVNAPSGFSGRVFDAQVNAVRAFSVNGDSNVNVFGTTLNLASTTLFQFTSDTILRRAAAANLALGAADAAAPVAQTISVQNVAGGTTNTAGVTTTWRGSAGTGNAASGTLQFQLGTPTSSGTTQHAFSTGLTLANIGSAGVASHAATFAGTIRTGGYTVATLPAAGTAGRIAYVTDATAPTYRGALVGGGAVTCAVFDTGAAWVSI